MASPKLTPDAIKKKLTRSPTREQLYKYKLTLIGLTVSSVIFLVTIGFGVDLFEQLVETMKALENYEVDELIIPIGIFGVFTLFDLLNRQGVQKIQIEIEKIKIYDYPRPNIPASTRANAPRIGKGVNPQ